MAVMPVGPQPGLLPRLIPLAVTAALAVLAVVPVAVPDYSVVAPDIVLMSVFHWCIYRPSYLPYIAIFVIGLFVDLISAGPVGLTSLILLLVRRNVLNQRRYFAGRSFPFIWGGFTIAASATDALRWAVGSMIAWQVLDPRSFVFQTVLTVACYPILTLVFARLQRAFMI